MALGYILGMLKVVPVEFFERPAPEVARELIGTSLVRRVPGGSTISWMLTEVEAYDGPEDLASGSDAAQRGNVRAPWHLLRLFDLRDALDAQCRNRRIGIPSGCADSRDQERFGSGPNHGSSPDRQIIERKASEEVERCLV
jgi:Methylpurine-DNA glycosylase (MPG)